MGDVFHAIIDAVAANRQLAYALVALLAFSESFPVFGSFVPGTTIIIAIAALVPSGAVDLWWLLAAAIVGAIVGDGFSYWLGHRYRERIVAIWPLSRYPQVIEMGRSAIERHGGKSVFVARFTPAVRAVVPLAAGILRMSPWRFYAVNVASAFAWAFSHIIPAVIAGASLAVAKAVGGRLLVLIIVLGVALWLMVVIVRLLVRRGLPRLGAAAARLWIWARGHDNWVSRELLSLLDPTHPETRGVLLLAAVLIGAAWIFAAILQDVVAGDPLTRADEAVLNFMQALRNPWGDRAMVTVSEYGDSVVTGAVIAVVALWLIGRRAWRSAAYWLGAVAFAVLFVTLLRFVLHVPESLPLVAGGDLYFPSSHAATTVTVYGFLVLLAGSELPARGRVATAVAAAILVVLQAVAQLYLGAHSLTEVGAGLAFGCAWLAGLGIVYLSHRPPPVQAGRMAAIAVLAFLVVGSFHAAANFGSDLRRYAVRPVRVEMAAAVWWRQGWERLPPRRIDLGGGLEEPLILQWAGPLEELEAELQAGGWRPPPDWTIASALAWLQPGVGSESLPVLTRLHDGRPDKLILTKPDPGDRRSRLILRIWRSNVRLSDERGERYPLWLGAVVVQQLHEVASLFTFGGTARDEYAARRILEDELAPARVVSRWTMPDSWGWNGWVVLAHTPRLELPKIAERPIP
jgi:undecaprenyl-diphosphatase